MEPLANFSMTTEVEIKELFAASKELTEELRNLRKLERPVNPNNPIGWSGLSNASYYRQVFAMEIKFYLDKLILQPDKEYYFNAVKAHRSPKTVQARFNQAFLFLCEKMDTEDGKYRALREEIEIRREAGGVRIRFKPKKTKLVGELVDSVVPDLTWYEEFEEWLGIAENGGSFTRDNVRISGEHQSRIRESLVNLGNFHVIRLDDNQVKIVRDDNI